MGHIQQIGRFQFIVENTLMMISHHVVIYVIPMKMVRSSIKHLCQNFTTSDGRFNISLMKMNINMMMMSGPILEVKAVGSTKQTRHS